MPLDFVAVLSSYQFASWLEPTIWHFSQFTWKLGRQCGFFYESSQAMLEDEHPDWLDPISHCPLATMEPLEDYEEDCENAPEEIQKEIDENRRAWANCKDS